jgi:predicted chitinase
MADNVNEIGNGRVYVVDPNPPGRETIPLEDLFIYVKFTAYPRSRTTYNGGDKSGNDFVNFGVEDEVNFISTKIRYNEDGKLDPAKQQTYATTDWTNISTFGENSSGGVLEGFGIKSISIKYNASLVPQVDITFTDVRGSALFDKLSDNSDIKSPYSVFFKLPYPIFRLSIKGYYGQKVDYCLHMVNWTSSFDNNTGNFDISANFLGYQQAILNDMVLGNVIGVVNTEEGFQKLQGIYGEDEQPIKIDDFLVKLSKLQIDSEIVKSQSDSFEQLKKLNGKLSLLKQLQSFIGTPIQKSLVGQNNGDESKSYLDIPNDEFKDITEPLTRTGTNLVNRRNYLSIRDYILVKNSNRRDVKNFVSNLTDAVKTYQKFITTTEDSDTPSNSVESQKKQKTNNNRKLNTSKDKDLIDSFFIGGTDEENNWKNFVNSFTKTGNEITGKTLTTILDAFRSEDTTISLTKNINIQKVGQDVNTNFSLETFNEKVTDDQFLRQTEFLSQTSVFLFDLRLQRSLLQDIINDVESTVKTLRDEVEEEINNELLENFRKEVGFNPNIENSFKVIMNNTQAMIETIYSVSKSSEEVNSKNRFSVLNRYETDIPKSITNKLISGESKKGVSFPSIYELNDGNESSKEIYIGNVKGVSDEKLRELFPEYDFVEKVFDNLVNRRKFLKQVTKAGNIKNLDGDNWFPLNPMDYEINPFITLNKTNDERSIRQELYKTILSRVVLLKNYSNFSGKFIKDISTYGVFDSINAKNIILNNITTNTIKEILKRPITKNEIINSGLGNLFIDEKDTNLTFKNNILEIGDIPLTSDRSDENSKYIELDNSDIINNSKKLWTEIVDKSSYGNRKENLKNSDSSYTKNNNITTNCEVTTFFKSINGDIIRKNSNNKNLNNLSYESINPNDNYINKTNFKSSGDCVFETYLVDGTFYNNQPTIYSRSYLALGTLPFTYFKEGILDILNNDGGTSNNARIIQLPKLYIYYIGSLLWRLKTNEVNFNITLTGNCSYNIFKTQNNKYLSKFGSKTIEKDLEDVLINLPVSVREFFIRQFQRWTKNNFNYTQKDGRFENILRGISNKDSNLSESFVNASKKSITDLFEETSNLIIYNSKIFDPNTNQPPLTITQQDLNNYVDSFNVNFIVDENTQSTNNNGEQNKKDKDKLDKLKLQLYNYFKNVNDKWVSDTEKGFNICGGKGRNLIDYFKFIDRGWNDIGDKASFDLKSFINLGTDLDVSVYLFISKILRDSNFLFQILPNYINYKDSEEVAQMFRPQTTLENNSSSGPIYCCIYAGGNSQALDIGERNNYYFNDDGFKFVNGVLPNDINSGDKVIDKGENDFSLVAFRVAFGSQNQSIFKSVSLNQQEHKETAEYFKVLSDTIDKRGATQRSYQGTNLIKLFKTRSYQCSVEALGCMNIQPLMYFDLQNVPFFNGAYLITNVTHQISPNNMSTSFNGLRQSKFITPPIEDITTSLDVNLDESFDVPTIEFVNLSPTDIIYSIGVNDPTGDFDFNTNFTVTNFNNIGVTNTDITQEVLNSFKEILSGNSITTNAQVSMFIANVLTQSENLTNREYSWEFTRSDYNNINYFDNVNPLYYDVITNNNNVKTPENKNIGLEPKYLTVQPIFTGSTLSGGTEQISYTPKDNSGKFNDKKYGNFFTGDAYRYKPRGYLYIIGRRQYFDFFGLDFYLKYPFSLSKNETQAMISATKVWKELKDNNNKSSFDYINDAKQDSGKSTIFSKTVEISQQLSEGKKIEKSFITFEKVLQNFTYKNDAGVSEPLINFFT